MSAFFSGFFGSDPGSIPTFSGQGDTNTSIFVPGASSTPTPSSSSGGGSSTTDWLNTIFKFAQLGTQTYLAQDAINSRSSNVQFGPNGQPLVAGSGVAAGGVNSILGTSSIWLFVFVAVLLLLLLKK